MKLRLNEVSQEGSEYIFNNVTAEMNNDLKDLIENNPYELKFFIRPLNHRDYLLKGKVKTETKEICSICAENFNYPIEAALHEVIIPVKSLEKGDKQARSNHFSELEEDAPSVTEYENDELNLSEFTHQAIALNVPFSPKCSTCMNRKSDEPFSYEDDMTKFEAEIKKQNPFNVLKNVKLN